MDFGKPPVVEILCEFHFIPGEGTPEWGYDTAKQFVDKYKERFPRLKHLARREFDIEISPDGEVKGRSPSAGRYVRARAYSADGSELLQLGQDALVYNQIRKEGKKPRFSSLIDPALEFYSAYLDFFVPEGMKQLVLRYVDIIDIPAKQFDLEDYFGIRLDVSTKDSVQISCNHDVAFQLGGEDDVLRIVMQSIKPNEDDGVSRFRLDWIISGTRVTELGRGRVKEWFNEAHDHIRRWFETFLKPSCLKLFDPGEVKG